ncbi:hypothetical protein ACNOYE_04775 [Nannocystaceae bacterium ST9]
MPAEAPLRGDSRRVVAWAVLALLLALLAIEPPVLPPVPANPPGGVPPILVRPSASEPASARIGGVVRGDGYDLELGSVTLELACLDCDRAATRVRPDLRGAFEFWGLAAGEYRLVVEQRFDTRVEQTSERTLTLAADEQATLELVIARPPPRPELPAELVGSLPADDPRRQTPVQDQGQTMRRVGLGVTVVGAAMGIGGVLVATVPPCGRDGSRGADCQVDIRNTIALILGVSAAGALTGGIVSMVVGRSLGRQSRFQAGIAPQRRGAGLVVVGRF